MRAHQKEPRGRRVFKAVVSRGVGAILLNSKRPDARLFVPYERVACERGMWPKQPDRAVLHKPRLICLHNPWRFSFSLPLLIISALWRAICKELTAGAVQLSLADGHVDRRLATAASVVASYTHRRADRGRPFEPKTPEAN